MGGVLYALLDLLEWFPHNVARNFHVNLLNLEIASLELQRLWGVLKTDRWELRAIFVRTRCTYAADARAAGAGELGAGPETR